MAPESSENTDKSVHEYLEEGHAALMHALSGITSAQAESPHLVNGQWNLKGLVSYLAAHERLLGDALSAQLSSGDSREHLAHYQYKLNSKEEFAQMNIDARRDIPFEELISEINTAHAYALKMLYLFTPDMIEKEGAVPWYDPKMSLMDYVRVSHYENKLIYADQILKYKAHLNEIGHIPTKF